MTPTNNDKTYSAPRASEKSAFMGKVVSVPQPPTGTANPKSNFTAPVSFGGTPATTFKTNC